MNQWISANLNDKVRFKLKPAGEKIWRDAHRFPGMITEPSLPEIKDGWATTQLWVLMEIFGPHINAFNNPPIEMGIAINYDN